MGRTPAATHKLAYVWRSESATCTKTLWGHGVTSTSAETCAAAFINARVWIPICGSVSASRSYFRDRRLDTGHPGTINAPAVITADMFVEIP
jgi:hypothetical protein